jgi:ribosomal-protein-alanine N-acetyltransferase
MQGLRFRGMRPDDLEDVLQIERASFDSPWERRQFAEQLRRENTRCYVAVERMRIVGYAALRFQRDTAQLLNLAVHPGWRRRGIGREFIDFLLDVARLRESRSIELKIRETNLDGQIFLRALGFHASGVLRGHFEDTQEDAYLMNHTTEVANNTQQPDA